VTVYLVGAGPGDPGLLTRRGAELLARAEVVVHDRLVAPELLDLAPPSALRIDVGKRPGAGPHRQHDINALLVEHGRRGAEVVRLKGGDPFLFGRGGEEAEALAAAGVPFEVVPGVTSALAAPAYAGVPVTHRGISTSVTVVTGHVGDPSAPGGVDWAALAKAGGTLVILMGMATRAEIARELVAGGRSPATPVLVVRWGTTPEHRSVRCTLGELAGVALEPPCVIVVGEVAGLDLGWFERRPLYGVTVVVTRARRQADAMAAALAQAGARVVCLPVIAVADPADGGRGLALAAQRARAYDWIVFTSANAVERFTACLRDGRDLGRARLGAVGRATAEALARAGLVADLVPARATAEDLVQAMPSAPAVPAGGDTGRVLFPRAAGAREVLARGLRAKGWLVDEVEAYRTALATPADGATPDAIEAARQADVVTFTSPSTVSAFVQLAGAGSQPRVVACIGPVTAEAARTAGFGVDVVAADQSASGLVDALVAHLGPLAGAGRGHA